MPAGRIAVLCFPTVRQTGVGAALMLEQPAQPGWLGACKDFCRLVAGERSRSSPPQRLGPKRWSDRCKQPVCLQRNCCQAHSNLQAPRPGEFSPLTCAQSWRGGCMPPCLATSVDASHASLPAI